MMIVRASKTSILLTLLLQLLLGTGAMLLLAGCGAATCLRSENADPELVALREAATADGREIRRHRIPTRMRASSQPVHIALYEIAPSKSAGDSRVRTVVLLHGVLSDHQCWRFVRGSLARDMRVLLVDLPGCGDSDKPKAQALGPRGYTPDAMAERVAQALQTHLDRAGAPHGPITLVGHSLGGTIAMRLLGAAHLRDRHGPLLRRVDRLVLLAPADVAMPNPPEIFRQIAYVSGPEIAIGDLVGILRGRIVEGTRSGFDDPSRAVREEAERLHEILRRPETRLAAQAILKQALPRRDDRPRWPDVERLQRDYANVDVPCLIVWGAHDETLPVANGYKLAAMLPQATLLVAPDCMHSIHLEHPARCAVYIRGFSDDPAAFIDRAAAGSDDPAATSSRVVVFQPAQLATARPAAAGD